MTDGLPDGRLHPPGPVMSSRGTSIALSVVVCTNTRARQLDDVLRDLCEQGFDRRRYEVIVVDNNSTDDTAAVVGGYARAQSRAAGCGAEDRAHHREAALARQVPGATGPS